MDRNERIYTLSDEQRVYLQMIVKLHNDKECTYDCLWIRTIKNAISHGSYSICGRENMNRMNIHYLAWKKRYDERIKRRTNKVLIDDIK